MNKRFLVLLIGVVVFGSVAGKYIYQKQNSEAVFNEDEIIFLQQGVYTNKENMEKNTKRLDPKAVVEEDNKYYVYVGITKNKQNAEKIKKIFTDQHYNIYEKKLTVTNEEFRNNLEQFDLLLSKTDKEEEILSIDEVILANYEQIFQKN